MLRRRWLVAGAAAGVIVIAASAVVALTLRHASPMLATSAPPIPSPETGRQASSTPDAVYNDAPPAAVTTAAPEDAGALPPNEVSPSAEAAAPADTPEPPRPTAGVRHFAIDPLQSSSRYVVTESVGSLDSTAVGVATGVSGDIYLAPGGVAVDPKSSFRVDLRTLKSTDLLLSAFLRLDVLNVAQFPFAAFSIDSARDFPAHDTGGAEFGFTVSGTLTIRGVSRGSTWSVKARQSGEFFTATADTDVSTSAYGIPTPNVGVARAKDGVHLQVSFVARKL